MIGDIFKEGKILTTVKGDGHFLPLGVERMPYSFLFERWSVCDLNPVYVHLTLFRFEVRHFAGWEDGNGRLLRRDWPPPETGQRLHVPRHSAAGQWDPPRVCGYLLSVQVSRPFSLPPGWQPSWCSHCAAGVLSIGEILTLLREKWPAEILASLEMGVRTRNL